MKTGGRDLGDVCAGLSQTEGTVCAKALGQETVSPSRIDRSVGQGWRQGESLVLTWCDQEEFKERIL